MAQQARPSAPRLPQIFRKVSVSRVCLVCSLAPPRLISVSNALGRVSSLCLLCLSGRLLSNVEQIWNCELESYETFKKLASSIVLREETLHRITTLRAKQRVRLCLCFCLSERLCLIVGVAVCVVVIGRGDEFAPQHRRGTAARRVVRSGVLASSSSSSFFILSSPTANGQQLLLVLD